MPANKRKAQDQGSGEGRSTKAQAVSAEADAKATDQSWNMKVLSWNVAGLRAWAKKDGYKHMAKEDADIVCLQETKCVKQKLPVEADVKGYTSYWTPAGKQEGYCGVGIYCKQKPLNVTYGLGDKEQDQESRLVTAEFDKFFIVTAYVPNSGRGLVTMPKRLAWDTLLKQHLSKLDAQKPLIYCGDFNVAHQEIDLKNPKSNTKNAGFTKEERDGFTELLTGGEDGFVDTFRHLYPDKKDAFSFWTYMGNARGKNVGWRLDYFLVSRRLLSHVVDSQIQAEVLGSDHCPVALLLNTDGL